MAAGFRSAAIALPKIAADAGAEIIWQPMLLGGVFKATGNQSPVAIPAKGRYMVRDIEREAAPLADFA